MLKKIPYLDAVQMLLDLPAKPGTRTVRLELAQGAVLAQDIVARQNVPPFDRSPYDGYALMGEDTASAGKASPVTLRIIEEVPAGYAPTKAVTSGTAVKILTGGPVPEGANCIIKYEDTEFDDQTVTIFSPIPPDTNIVRAGEDVRRGEALAKKGSIVTAPMLAVFASQGFGELEIYERPKAAIITTGSELKMPGGELAPGQIYNSNLFSVTGYLRDAGIDTENYGIVPDSADGIAEVISKALDTCDCVITTGGASVGDYDWAVDASVKCGAKVLFWKAAMKPGGSMVAANRNGKLILSLSGNPAAALIGLHVVGMPYLRRLCGKSDFISKRFSVKLKYPLKKKSPQARFLRGHLEIDAGQAFFVSHDAQGNGDTFSFVGCDLIGCVPAGSPPLEAGSEIEVFYI